MPTTVTAYDVRIVPPGDGAIAAFIAREVISEWNGLHGRTEKRLFISAPESASSALADVLLAFYCPSHASPGCEQAARIEREIETYVEARRPVLVYCSSAREGLHDEDEGDPAALAAFQNRFRSRVVLASFGDEKEFRSGLSRHLLEMVRTHAYFNAGTSPEIAPAALSKLAQTLLIEACADPEAYIGRFQDGDQLRLQANGKQLVEPGSSAVWQQAFGELLSGGYIRDAGCQGRLFQISTDGFAFLKTIGVTPVGYIAELGGM